MKEPQSKNLNEFFKELLESKGVTIDKLFEATGIPRRYLTALNDGEIQKLPPAPYVRGYLTKIAEVLDVDSESLWQSYKNEISLRTSGVSDRLPINRFALKSMEKKIFIGGIVVAVIVLLYLGWKVQGFWGMPKLTITNPETANLIINVSKIRLTGEISVQDKLTINGEEVLADTKGQFGKDFMLQPGINTFEFKVKRFLGKEVKIVRQVFYQPSENPITSSTRPVR